MTQIARVTTYAVALALSAASCAASADSWGSAHACSAKIRGAYGFQCQGFANVNAPPDLPALEPVTLIGTVVGSDSGVFDGYGTFSSHLGSIRQHVVGQAVYQDKNCAGHIKYQIWVALPDGTDGPQLPPLDFDFAVVDNGFEILGTPNALPGVTGDLVPRLSCRLVRIRG